MELEVVDLDFLELLVLDDFFVLLDLDDFLVSADLDFLVVWLVVFELFVILDFLELLLLAGLDFELFVCSEDFLLLTVELFLLSFLDEDFFFVDLLLELEEDFLLLLLDFLDLE